MVYWGLREDKCNCLTINHWTKTKKNESEFLVSPSVSFKLNLRWDLICTLSSGRMLTLTCCAHLLTWVTPCNTIKFITYSTEQWLKYQFTASDKTLTECTCKQSVLVHLKYLADTWKSLSLSLFLWGSLHSLFGDINAVLDMPYFKPHLRHTASEI